MKQPVDIIFPPLEDGKLPFYRIVLRGISQLCLQTNELTGLFFLAAVFIASPIASAYLLVAAILGPLGRILIGERREVLATGLPALNPCLIALSIPVFFNTGWTNIGMWVVLILCIASAVLLVRLFLRIFSFPIIALPFLIIFWILWAIEPHVSFLQPSELHLAAYHTFHPVVAVLYSLGQAIFSATLWSGVLFLIGVLLSNWRHGVVALLGAVIGTFVAYYYSNVAPESANLGLYGFNGVLAAVAVFVTCQGKLRLSILGALLATIFIPLIADFGVQTLSAPFVFTTWLMILLGWVEDNWFRESLKDHGGD
ncbi:MAG: urea transporter [Thermodesulfobacteriota bacterium]